MKITRICAIFAIFALGVIGTAALANRALVESERIQHCRQLLRESGHNGVRVQFRGDQCIVTGSVESAPAKVGIERMLLKMEGVGVMDTSGLLVAGP